MDFASYDILVAGDSNGVLDDFVQTSSARITAREPVDPSGKVGNRASTSPRMSAHGNTVAFVSSAGILVSSDLSGLPDVLRRG